MLSSRWTRVHGTWYVASVFLKRADRESHSPDLNSFKCNALSIDMTDDEANVWSSTGALNLTP